MTNPSTYQLFLSPRSPFARRIRLAMRRLKIEYTERVVDVFQDNPELIAANPLGLVPTLLTPNDGAIADSSTIIEYLQEKTGAIWPKDQARRIQMRQASSYGVGLIQSSVLYFQESALHETPSHRWMEEHLVSMENTLLHGSKMPASIWIENGELTQAGWDLVVGLDYVSLRIPELKWREQYPTLVSIHHEAKKNPDFLETTPKL